jgi:hypothetical protein
MRSVSRLLVNMKSMLLKIISITTVLLLLMPATMAGTASRKSSFASFKRQMMPKVGKKITVIGRLASGKLGWLVTFKKWGVYIYAIKDSDNPKMSGLNRYNGQTVEATGALRYYAGSPSVRTDVAAAPERFFLDVAEAGVTVLRATQQSRQK